MTTPLHEQIVAEIAASGPITVERFWEIALFDRKHGYYSSKEPFGRSGDFTTAPEISQMFGELLGAWIAGAWERLGRPSPFCLAEIGPGRGTLMADILRTLRTAAPSCLAAARIRLVETSERLAAVQGAKLEPFDLPIKRVRRVADLEPMPIVVFANELFDALPIRQLVFADGAWRERMILALDTGSLDFALGTQATAVPNWLTKRPEASAVEGAIVEWSPARETLAAELGSRIEATGGAGLFIDYGHAHSAVGDTFQAVADHRFVPVLANPGEADLTSHVDFAALSRQFAEAGLTVSSTSNQGDFLLAMGLLERAGKLGAPLDETGRDRIRADVQRLAGAGEADMGVLFKVIAVASRALDMPPFA